MTKEPIAVSLVGEAVDIVHGTIPRAREVWRGELLVWIAKNYRERYLEGAPMPPGWASLGRPLQADSASALPVLPLGFVNASINRLMRSAVAGSRFWSSSS